jgi:branched-chain amino acid transport system permease protein
MTTPHNGSPASRWYSFRRPIAAFALVILINGLSAAVHINGWLSLLLQVVAVVPVLLLPLRSLVPVWAAIAFAIVLHGTGYLLEMPYVDRVVIECGIAIIAAVSLTIVNGFTGQFSIGHAAFITIGGYVGGFLSYYACLGLFDLSPAQMRSIEPTMAGGAQWLLLLAAILGGTVAALAGWLVGLPSLRLRGDYLAIVTLGFGEIVRVLLQQTPQQLDTPEAFDKTNKLAMLYAPPVGGATGFADLPKVTNLLWTYLFVGATVLFAYRLKQSSTGRALLSIREDEIAAESMGINTAKLKVRAFMLAAFFAGVAGTLYAHLQGTVLTPKDAGFQRSFDVVMMVVLGGLGSVSGSVLAAIVITVANAFLTPLGPWRMILFAFILILMMIFRPKGLFGLNEVWDVFGRGGKRQEARGKS